MCSSVCVYQLDSTITSVLITIYNKVHPCTHSLIASPLAALLLVWISWSPFLPCVTPLWRCGFVLTLPSHWFCWNILHPSRSTRILREAGVITVVTGLIAHEFQHAETYRTHTCTSAGNGQAHPPSPASAVAPLSTNLSQKKINFLINKVCLMEGLCCLQQQEVLEATLIIVVQPLQSLWSWHNRFYGNRVHASGCDLWFL